MARDSNGGAVLLLAALVFGGLYLSRDSLQNREAPEFSLPEAYGGHLDLASYRGRPVLLVFWTTSCGICRHELPLLSRIAPEMRSKGIAVMAINIGGGSDARDYMRSNHIRMTSLMDETGQVARAYRVNGVPKLVLIGADGKIVRSEAGMADESVLREWTDAVGGS
jgi:peroxiredoxin